MIYYISRFYDFQLWGREGLFGIEGLRPLLPPAILMEELPASERVSDRVWSSRAALSDAKPQKALECR